MAACNFHHGWQNTDIRVQHCAPLVLCAYPAALAAHHQVTILQALGSRCRQWRQSG